MLKQVLAKVQKEYSPPVIMAALVEIAMVAVLERRLVLGDGNASIVSASRSLDGVHGLACAHTSVY